MSTTTQPHPTTRQDELTPVLSDRLALDWRHTVLCAWFALFFMYLNYIPLFHSDIWCHVHYGQWMLEHGTLPQEDPFMPLAAGMRVVNNAWLSQLVFALCERWGGAQSLSNLYALTVLATYLLLARVFFLISGRKGLAVLGAMLVLAFGWTRHAIIRPEIFGGLCFALLLWLLVRVEPWRSRAVGFPPDNRPTCRQRFPRVLWLGIPLLFLVWANAHGSFAVGLGLLACHTLGRVIEVAWQQRRLVAVLADPGVRRWTWLTELALAATLVNPYGLDLLLSTAQFGQNENLRDVLEWFPLKLIDFEGIQFTAALLLLMVLLRHSRQRMRPAEILALLVFGAAVAPTVRMIGWFAPLLVFSAMPHLTDVWSRWQPALRRWWTSHRRPPQEESSPLPRFTFSLLCLLIVWCAFALSPISQPLLGEGPRDPARIYSRGTPLGITGYLQEHPPQGLVWGPQWWGDWLVWDGPADLQVFMTTTIHLAPRRVWQDYMRVAQGRAGWEGVLDRYNVNTLIVHKELQSRLTRAVRRSGRWHITYEDHLGIVLQRIGSTDQPDSAAPVAAGASEPAVGGSTT